MCKYMCIGMCSMHSHTRMDMCLDMCTCMCIGNCADIHMDMYIRLCIDMCMGMRVNICIHMYLCDLQGPLQRCGVAGNCRPANHRADLCDTCVDMCAEPGCRRKRRHVCGNV